MAGEMVFGVRESRSQPYLHGKLGTKHGLDVSRSRLRSLSARGVALELAKVSSLGADGDCGSLEKSARMVVVLA